MNSQLLMVSLDPESQRQTRNKEHSIPKMNEISLTLHKLINSQNTLSIYLHLTATTSPLGNF